ncbi:MAG TPA: cysteine peptidase family C39 domain-containing protein [Gemmatimonadota bacterium]|nr:cysteine peptidase family C39 domain-containing protein [Gemmatimonadota bacterium]
MSRAGAAALAAALLLLAPAGARALTPTAVGAPPVPRSHLSVDTTAGQAVLDVPYVSQTEELCGGAAVAMVFRFWGRASLDAQAFAPLVDDSARGIRTGVLQQAVRRLGWRSLAYRGSLEGLRDQVGRGRPLIVLLRVSPDRWHYVVVVAVGEDRVLVHDPARAPFQPIPIPEFRRMWEPSGRWTLLALPPVGERGEALPDLSASPDSAAGGETARDTAGAAPRDSARGAPAEEGPCAAGVAAGVRAARADSLEVAARRLRAAAETCPASPAPPRELAGVRFRQGRWDEAAAEARRALHLGPGDAYTVRLLGGALYMAGRRGEALRAWNALGEPRVAALDVYGLRRVRYRVVARRVDLAADSVLTPRALALVRRRLDATPAFGRARVDWRPTGRGRADLRVAVFEKPPVPGGPLGLVVALAAGLPERSVRLPAGSLAGAGETWTATWRWWEERPRVALDLRVPDAAGITGTWEVEGAWSRAAFRMAGGGGAADTLREERWRGGLALSAWASPHLRWRAGLSLDRWTGLGTAPGAAVGLALLAAGDRVRVAAGARGWSGPDRAFGTARIELGWRTSGEPRGLVASARAGLDVASAGAPLDTWPGAGTGHARPALLRAHPLLDGGVVAGPVFGRRVASGGVEATAWAAGPGPLSTGAAVFVDAARAWRRPGGGSSPAEVDVGAGLRLALPVARAHLRVDVAHGLRDGENAVSVGWEGGWPGSGER